MIFLIFMLFIMISKEKPLQSLLQFILNQYNLLKWSKMQRDKVMFKDKRSIEHGLSCSNYEYSKLTTKSSHCPTTGTAHRNHYHSVFWMSISIPWHFIQKLTEWVLPFGLFESLAVSCKKWDKDCRYQSLIFFE